MPGQHLALDQRGDGGRVVVEVRIGEREEERARVVEPTGLGDVAVWLCTCMFSRDRSVGNK